MLTSNYQAEYGRSSGGTINVITKSGSRDFRGGGFYSKRHESFNANEWLNNKLNQAEADLPLRLPRLQHRRAGHPARLQQRPQQAVLLLQPGVPAAHQPRQPRTPDDADGARAAGRFLAIVRQHRRADPRCAIRRRARPFPGNRIPANRIDANGQAHAQPVPAAQPHGRPRRPTTPSRARTSSRATTRCVRVDWNIGRNTNFYSRVNWGYEAFKGGWGFVLNNANWPQLPIAYEIHSYGVVNTLLHTFSPTLVAEVTVGLNHGKQTVEPLTEADRDRNDQEQRRSRWPAEFLSRSQSRPHRPERDLRRRRPEPRQHARRLASKGATRSSARTTSGTRR